MSRDIVKSRVLIRIIPGNTSAQICHVAAGADLDLGERHATSPALLTKMTALLECISRSLLTYILVRHLIIDRIIIS